MRWFRAASAILAVAGWPVGAREPEFLGLRVLMFNDAPVPASVLGPAQAVASRVFAAAGIEIEWTPCPGCQGPFSPRDLVIRILPGAGVGLPKQGDVFGIALLPPDGQFGRQAYVFFSRLETLAWGNVRKASRGQLVSHVPPGAYSSLILGVVLAHELGHLLLGSHSHSESDIMRPSWGPQSLEDAYDGRCAFTPDQAAHLREAMRARSRSASVLRIRGEGHPASCLQGCAM